MCPSFIVQAASGPSSFLSSRIKHMDFMNIVYFLGKAVLIELTIELCRFAIYTIWHNAFSENVFLSHSNRYFSWFINGVETMTVISLLYLGYSVPLIIAVTLCFTFFLKQVGGRISLFN